MSGPPEHEPPEEGRGRDPVNDSAGSDASGASGGSGDSGAADREGVAPEMDEEALRRLLQESVRDLEPSPDALDHLHRAVPARRARRRQALVGVAAAVVVGGAAIPALLHVDIVPGGDDKPMHAASHEGAAQQKEGSKGEQQGGKEHKEGGKGKKNGGKEGGGSNDASPSAGGDSSGPDPSSTMGAMSPSCTRVQLGKGVTESSGDAQGRVYGSFQVVNVSDAVCTVEDDGIVGATAMGGARSGSIQVLDHTSGDAATNLPDPSLAPGEVVLQPGAAYMVKFAWIPRAGGGTSGCSTSSTPPPDGGADGGQEGGDSQPTTLSEGGDADAGTSGGTTGGTTGGDDGSDPGDGGGTPSKSVVVSHTPDVGGPVAETVLQGACAGTIYRTAVLPAA